MISKLPLVGAVASPLRPYLGVRWVCKSCQQSQISTSHTDLKDLLISILVLLNFVAAGGVGMEQQLMSKVAAPYSH